MARTGAAHRGAFRSEFPVDLQIVIRRQAGSLATSRKIVQHITRGFVVAGVAAWPCLALAKTTVPLPKPRPQAANAKLQDTKPQEANAQDIKPKIQDAVPTVARPTIASLAP